MLMLMRMMVVDVEIYPCGLDWKSVATCMVVFFLVRFWENWSDIAEIVDIHMGLKGC